MKGKPGLTGDDFAEPAKITETGRSAVLEGRTTSEMEKSRSGVKQAEYYVVPYAELGMPKEDYAVFEAFSAFNDKLQAKPGGKKKQSGIDAPAFRDGMVPLRTVKFDDAGSGAVKSTQTVTSVSFGKIDPAEFANPPATPFLGQ